MSKTFTEKLVTWLILLGMIIMLILVVGFIGSFQWNSGEKIYTGYIYSSTTDFGVTSGHLRFSENAGEDNQPSFCVNDEDRQKLTDLAGSGKKVRVIEPSGLRFAWPWQCAFPVTIEVLEDA